MNKKELYVGLVNIGKELAEKYNLVNVRITSHGSKENINLDDILNGVEASHVTFYSKDFSSGYSVVLYNDSKLVVIMEDSGHYYCEIKFTDENMAGDLDIKTININGKSGISAWEELKVLLVERGIL